MNKRGDRVEKLTIFQSSRINADIGGAQACYMALNRLLKEKGHRVIEFAANHPKNKVSDYSEYFVNRPVEESIDNLSLFRKIKAACDSIYALDVLKNTKKLIDIYKPHIADVHNLYYQLSPSVLAPLHKAGIPIVHHLHDYAMYCVNGVCEKNGTVCERCKGGKYYRAVINRCYHNSYSQSFIGAISKIFNNSLGVYEPYISKYIVTSQFQKNFLLSWGIPEKKMHVIPLFFDGSSYPTVESQVQKPQVLYFGEMKKRKGPQLVYELAKKIPSVKFVFVGRGPYAEILRKRSRDECILNLEFHDHLWKYELFKILQESMFSIIPSIFYESFGRVIIEAFYYAKPVLGSRLGSIPEIIVDGHNGFTFNPGDVDDLYEKARYLIEDVSLRYRLGQNARADACKKYNKELYYRQLKNIYDALL